MNFSCKSCNFQTTNTYCLSSHVTNIHHQEKRICTDCNKTFSSSYLSRHRKLFHTEGQPQHNCDICPFQTIYERYLRKHKLKVH